MRYEEITAITRSEAEIILRQDLPEIIPVTLVRLAYYEPDWKWVQDTCITFSTHRNVWVRRVCATCFGHLARIHGKLEMENVSPVLNRLLLDPEVKGEAEDAIEDIKIFLRPSPER
jgi:hypothetical protein